MVNYLEYIWLIPTLPLAGCVLIGLLGLITLRGTGNKLNKRLVSTLALGSVGLTLLLSILCVYQLFALEHEEMRSIDLFTWISGGALPLANGGMASFEVPWGFQLDPLSAVMILVVTVVGFLIHIYSTGYMWDDTGYYRFFSYMNLFMFAMLTLVLANNFLMMFVGWEGVGLCSYLLIGFYFDKKSAGDAGKKAFVVNRIGDAGFILGMMLIFVHFGSLRFEEVFDKAAAFPQAGPDYLFWATLCLFIGACGKSAQIPIYVWLPDAMEGPTPVSALIHAATMVTAGVYMVCRCNALYSRAPEALMIVAVVGSLTAIFAATIGFAQTDIKRVLAYSTVSQLGYMFAALGVGAFVGGIFHLMTHAFFKALLFLASGSVIMAMHHEQDMLKMGGLKKYLPWTFWTMAIGTVAISGIPPFAGFFSKDEILWRAWSNGHPVIWFLLWIGAGMTAFYMFRLLFLTFFGKERMDEHTKHHIKESPRNVVYPLAGLAVLSTVGGFVGFPEWTRIGNKFEHFLEPVLRLPESQEHAIHHSASQEILFTALSIAMAAVGIYLAYRFYIVRPGLADRVTEKIKGLYRLVFHKYYVDEIYDALFVNRTKDLGDACFWVDSKFVDGAVNGTAATTRGTATISRLFDKYVVDGLVNLIGWINMLLNRIATSFQTGFIQRYALMTIFGIVVIILIYYKGLLEF
jgi:NADH-quinone oxidoreductase subunit L